jgi:hypothetical protein
VPFSLRHFWSIVSVAQQPHHNVRGLPWRGPRGGSVGSHDVKPGGLFGGVPPVNLVNLKSPSAVFVTVSPWGGKPSLGPK